MNSRSSQIKSKSCKNWFENRTVRGTEAEKVEILSPLFFSTPRNSLVCWAQRPIPSNRNLHKLLRVIFPEVLMEYFEISCWHDDFMKNTTWNVQITRVEL